ncbi:MAG TPA: chloride channel protein, partial [Candidatus Sulfotelmatobacter sp.]|nr:chloride channel protein [Candidatus Sulfotelmatobacter sp.]
LVVLKLFAVTTSYASGNAGGIFGPSLFLGAMLGGTIGNFAHRLLPAHTATSGAYALVGMGALFAGIVRAPMTSVLMIFEMTRDYSVIVPLMISNLASLFISSKLQKQPIYEALAHQDGIHLPNPKSHRQLGERKVSQVMRSATEILAAEMTVGHALERIQSSPFRAWPVADEGSIIGVLSRAKLEVEHSDGRPETRLIDALGSLDFPHVHTDQPLHLALERMSAARLDLLPVVNRANVHQLEGIITLKDVLDSYLVDPTGSA